MGYSQKTTDGQLHSLLTDEWERVETRISRSQLRTMNDFYDYCIASGLKSKSIINYLRHLRKLALFTKKPFKQTDKKDIVKFLANLKYGKSVGNKKKGEQVSINYSNECKITLKKFFRWLHDTGKNYPPIVDWIETKRKSLNAKLPSELLTQEDIKAMIETASNPRDKCLISILYDSACRIGEILSMTLRCVKFDEYGAVIMVEGKTGMRRVRLIDSAPYLSSLVNSHPFKNDLDKPMFIDLGNRYGQPLGYYAVLDLVKRLARRAGIKKRVHPHLWRHSKLTEMAKVLTEQELKVYAGWTGGSYMPKIYVHLSGEDVEKKILMKRGLITGDEKEKDSLLKAKECPSCGLRNPADSKICQGCLLPLDVENKVRKKNEMLKKVFEKKPELVDALLDAIKELGLEKELED